MKKKPFAFSSLLLLTAFLAFTACGSSENSMNPSLPPESEPESAPPAPETFEPVTEEELRLAIADLADEETVSPQKQEYYEKLYAMDLFTEEDYLALAQIYADTGDWKQQRLMLSKVLRLYPNREYAQLLGDIIIRGDSTDEEMTSLAAFLTTALAQQDVPALNGLPQNPAWRQILPAELSGVRTRVQYRGENDVLQIAADGLTTEITWQVNPDSLFYYKSDATGTMLATASREGEAYSGPATVTYFDGTGNMVRSFQGALSGNICVDRFTIHYQGTDYSGRLDETGKTLEEQLKEVTQKGGVCYAYGPGEKTYLYQKDTTVEDFRIDAAYLGLPEYAEWR